MAWNFWGSEVLIWDQSMLNVVPESAQKMPAKWKSFCSWVKKKMMFNESECFFACGREFQKFHLALCPYSRVMLVYYILFLSQGTDPTMGWVVTAPNKCSSSLLCFPFPLPHVTCPALQSLLYKAANLSAQISLWLLFFI